MLLRARLSALLLFTLAATLGTLSPPASAAPSTVAATRWTGVGIAMEASQHVGKPYRYGATGPSSFDCSGFTRYVYAQFGKALPHNSAAQYRVTRKVSKSAKQVGDLIFTRSGSGRIGHVGIYAGNGNFWVAPRTGSRVKLQRIYTSNYVVGRV